MPRDSGGWRSSGKLAQIRCPKCGCDDSTLIETEIYGKRTETPYCNVCSFNKPWEYWEQDEHGDSEK